MFKFSLGDLVHAVPWRTKAHNKGGETRLGVVSEMREMRYEDTEGATMKVVSAIFGDEMVTLPEKDFVLVKKLENNG
jgi:hypothetical protein